MAKVAHKLQAVGPRTRLRSLVRVIEADDEVIVDRLLQLSRSHRALAPLGLTAGAFTMLLHGLRLLLSDWHLVVVEILPAMWIWLAMADLKLHVLHGASFRVIRGPVLIPIGLAIVALTAAAFFLNAVFAFAIAQGRRPNIRRSFSAARQRAAAIVVPGAVIGLLLALSATVVTRWGRPWFALSLGIVVGAMMVAYVALPARLIGFRPAHSKRDKLAAGALGGLLSVAVCTPPYLLARLGILLLGSLLVPGVALLAVGATLQAGTTGAVRAIKMSASLTARRDHGQREDG
jgi:hypothetical protein